jgi:fructose-specific component phosphotransferase system IIB-like protein
MRALAIPFSVYDGSLIDDLESSFAYPNATLARAIGRAGQALAAAAALCTDIVGSGLG